MDSTPKRSFIAQQAFASHAQAQTITQLAEQMRARTLGLGEVLFREYDPGDFVFIVVSGRLEVTKRVDHDREVHLRTLHPGDVGGLTSMAMGRQRSATVRAETAAELYAIDSVAFRQLMGERPDLTLSLVAFLGDKVRDKTDQLATLLSRLPQDPRPAVAVFDAKPYDVTHLQAASADLAFHFFEARLSPETAVLAAGHRAVCAFVNDDLSAPVLQQLATLGVGLIALRCAGFNNVDLAAAEQHGLSVARVPAYSPHAVAEHAAALILALNRKTHRAYLRVREGNFSLAGLSGFDLHGQVAGVVGTGKIGRCLCEILRGFGMEVLAFDAQPDPHFAAQSGVRYVELDEVLTKSRLISLHAPLTSDTHHLINAERMARMRRGVMIINTSRGALIDTSALIAGLKTGHIGAAGLDVYEEEGGYFFEDFSSRVLNDDILARLLTFPNVLITGHQGFLTEDALRNIAETTACNIHQFLAGKRGRELENAVR